MTTYSGILDTTSGTPLAGGTDPFDPQRLRISQDFTEAVGVKPTLPR